MSTIYQLQAIKTELTYCIYNMNKNNIDFTGLFWLRVMVMLLKYLALLNGMQHLPKTNRLSVIYLTKMGFFRINKNCNSGSATMVSHMQSLTREGELLKRGKGSWQRSLFFPVGLSYHPRVWALPLHISHIYLTEILIY